MTNLQNSLKLCLITNQTNQTTDQYLELIRTTIYAGISLVQLRDKFRTIEEIKNFALALQKTLKPYKIPLIINDHVKLTSEINADGVHLGKNDLPVEEARNILGKNKIIGISIESLDDLNSTNKLEGNYYIAASAVFASSSKLDCKKIWGIDGLKEIVKISRHPVVAVGNINQTNVKNVMKTGAAGIAVISALHDFPLAAFDLRNSI